MDGKAAGNCGFAFSAVRTVNMLENWYGMMVVTQASTIVSLLRREYQSTVVGTANWDQAEWSKKS